jgi:probable F420-dependent oxidoreductase
MYESGAWVHCPTAALEVGALTADHDHGPVIGMMFANGARSADPAHAAALAQAAERAGCESLWAVQHVVVPVSQRSRYPYSDAGTVPGGSAIAVPDPLVWLAWVGAVTREIRLATGILVVTQQHPLVVAKQVATLDRLVGGRVVLGVGAGWLKEEFQALDADFDRRGGRLDEAIEVLRAAWAPGPCQFDGAHFSFESVNVEPKPVSKIPIVIGGHSAAAARRAGRLADGFFPLARQGVQLADLVAIARRAAGDGGRDPADIEITAEMPRTEVEAEVQARLGVHRVVVNAPHRPTSDLVDAVQRLVATARARTAR